MEANSWGTGILVTGTNEEQQQPQERLVKQRWELTYKPEQWYALSKEEREAFLLKDTLSMIILDLDKCLVRNVGYFKAESRFTPVL